MIAGGGVFIACCGLVVYGCGCWFGGSFECCVCVNCTGNSFGVLINSVGYTLICVVFVFLNCLRSV